MLEYQMPLYRPPSEADSVIFQVTLGCSFNRCSFCSMYRSKHFEIRPIEKVLSEIDGVKRDYGGARRVFLADGDALACSTEHLLMILNALHEAFPALERVTAYALPNNLQRKSSKELAMLREHGLTMIYYGIESGSAEILKRITKGATPQSMAEGLNKAKVAGLSISATVILGLGGRTYWQEHIDETARLVNRSCLDYLSTLQLHLEPVVEAEFMEKFARRGGEFKWQDDVGILEEQARLVTKLEPSAPLVFRSNHASNALPLRGTLPGDRDLLLSALTAARAGQIALRPPQMRGL